MEKVWNEQRQLQVGLNIRQKFSVSHRQVVEACWCIFALLLFMILGPFAAPIAVIAVMNLPPEERGETEPEMLSETVRYQLR